MIYLDNAATTKIHPDVLKAMEPFLTSIYGNPNSMYYRQAVDSKLAIEQSRKDVASLFGVESNDVIFTSGAGESNNTIIKGIAEKNPFCHFITSEAEHSTILESLRYLETKGYEVTYIPVDNTGKVSATKIKEFFKPNTKLVSIMWANNEVGTINDILEISRICHENNIFFHTDATQAVGKVKCNLREYPDIDFLSMSAHKIYGPKGVGCLIMRNLNTNNLPITPLIHGGDQEFGLRGSTLATHQIVGLGAASKLCRQNLNKNIEILNKLENELKKRLVSQYGAKIQIINDFSIRVPGLLSVRFIGINNQILLSSIAENIAASSGAACSNSKPSHVLISMGYEINIINQIIRLSISPYDEYNDFKNFK